MKVMLLNNKWLWCLSRKTFEKCVEKGIDKRFFERCYLVPWSYRVRKRSHQDYNELEQFISSKEFRTDTRIIEAIEETGDSSYINIVEIPFDSVEGWYIQPPCTEEDCYEWGEVIHENHRSWS